MLNRLSSMMGFQARIAASPTGITSPGSQYLRSIENCGKAVGSSGRSFPTWEQLVNSHRLDEQASRGRSDVNIVIETIPPTASAPGVLIRTESGRHSGQVFSARSVRIWNPFTKNVWVSEAVNAFKVTGLAPPPGAGGVQPGGTGGSGLARSR